MSSRLRVTSKISSMNFIAANETNFCASPFGAFSGSGLSDSLFRLNIPSLTSYPAAVAAVLVCAAVVSLKVYQAPPSSGIAMADSAALPVHQSVIDQLSTERVADNFTLSAPLSSRSLGPDLSRQVSESAYTHRASTPPRYVLDRLPVSYEPSFNF